MTTEPGLAQANPSPQGTDSSAQPPSSEVLLIERMSVRYDGLEDRIALDITNSEGRLARLWLTRYGTDVLVRTTAARVESYAAEQLAKAKVAPNAAVQLRQSALATQQLTARLTQRQASAVALPPGTPEHLVTGFAMPPNQRSIQLDFKCRPDLAASVRLRPAELFQWLGALQRQYQRAGWSTEVWPSWLSQRG